MKLFSLILLLSCLANVAMGAINLRAEKAEELSQRIVKDAKAKSVELGAQLNAAYDATLSVRNLVASKASEHEDGWLGLAIEFRRADRLEDFLGDAAASSALVEARRIVETSQVVDGEGWFYGYLPVPVILLLVIVAFLFPFLQIIIQMMFQVNLGLGFL